MQSIFKVEDILILTFIFLYFILSWKIFSNAKKIGAQERVKFSWWHSLVGRIPGHVPGKWNILFLEHVPVLLELFLELIILPRFLQGSLLDSTSFTKPSLIYQPEIVFTTTLFPTPCEGPSPEWCNKQRFPGLKGWILAVLMYSYGTLAKLLNFWCCFLISEGDDDSIWLIVVKIKGGNELIYQTEIDSQT